VTFGGRVTGSISGKTDVLVVGKNPGYSKVSQARKRPNMLLVTLKDLNENLIQAKSLPVVDAEVPFIERYSSGYRGNGLGLLHVYFQECTD
jgi:hypothetical protein